jgi:thymidylate kinase
MLVAFDGVETSGKTTLADQVTGMLAGRTVKAARVSIDRVSQPAG